MGQQMHGHTQDRCTGKELHRCTELRLQIVLDPGPGVCKPEEEGRRDTLGRIR